MLYYTSSTDFFKLSYRVLHNEEDFIIFTFMQFSEKFSKLEGNALLCKRVIKQHWEMRDVMTVIGSYERTIFKLKTKDAIWSKLTCFGQFNLML